MNAPSPLARIRIVLSQPSHPGNIGGAARAMKTMGLSRLVLVNPRFFPDRQADAMAANATDVLQNARVCSTLAEALAGTVSATALTARRRELAVAPLWAREAAAELAGQARTGEVALVFGNETAGLSNDEVALCKRWASIPTDPGSSSLNLAAAVQLLCYELRMAAVDPGPPPPILGAGEPAPHEEVEGLVKHLERAAIASGFLDPAAPKRLMPRMRRLFSRAGLEREEVNILRGMLASFEKKVD
ncbi:MAG: RNA methyltransferase [Candidatus Nitricoxidivorans perseverans]|uniref:tRNA (cytidine/uridine-2'-O-)-methyltransferase TrmJ n=1 Tax=Candidatus Nitricoxidivorans perseverans TaxID=2975601 RepID=A0AA49FMM9_9PROT|nr:MAG: RNA methyltransferase [Candidatus Nitricoxidivorans perseverans]